MSGHHLLIVDDDEGFCVAVADHFGARDLVAQAAHSLADSQRLLKEKSFDVLLLDQRLPDGDGLDFARRLLETDSGSKVIMVTAFGDVARAVDAMRLGAFDYLLKPVNLKELEIVVERAVAALELEKTARLSEFVAGREATDARIIGQSIAAQTLRSEIEAVAAAYPSPVLLTGETGTGKSVAARVVHALSPVPPQKFVGVNCAALPESMFEAELFGHERGGFTGAYSARRGMFELADGGTLLLDEVGEIPLAMQAKLLRVLDEGAVRRVGGQTERRVRLRVIASTNRDVERLVEEGRFRADLYFRLAVACIRVPPLRERREDIADLARSFAARAAGGSGALVDVDAFLARMSGYSWPGNIRELKNLVERAAIMGASGGDLGGLPTLMHARAGSQPAAPSDGSKRIPTLAEAEAELIDRALAGCEGNKARAARVLGISRSTLKRKLAQIRDGVWRAPNGGGK